MSDYILKEKQDFEIFDKIQFLQKQSKISKQEKYFLKFLKTQLKQDWRKPIVKELNRMLRNKKLKYVNLK